MSDGSGEMWRAALRELDRVVERSSGVPLDPVAAILAPVRDEPRLAWLQQTFELDDFETAALVAVMAVELDTRFERLYATLQGDAARQPPRADLLLALLCPLPGPCEARAEQLSADGALLRHQLLVAGGEVSSPLARTLRIDRQIADFLLYREAIDARLRASSRMLAARGDLAEAPLPAYALACLASCRDRLLLQSEPQCAYLRTDDPMQAQMAASGLASALGTRVLDVDLRQVVREAAPAQCLALAFREAWLRCLTLHLRHADALAGDSDNLAREALFGELTQAPGMVLVSGAVDWRVVEWGVPHVVVIDVRDWGEAERNAWWLRCLAQADVAADAATVDALARRFRLPPTQVARSVVDARERMREQPITAHDALFGAARDQSGQRLADLALRIRPRYSWDDVVLPADSVAQLREICARIDGRSVVLDAWGFEGRLSQGKGTSVLFAGPSGTGKTMTAEIIASQLGLDLYKINLANIVSKYIGETEKNLDRVFDAAHDANAVLVFDEAEALFGKRSEVRDAHDRYANIEIAYLLARIEAFDGLAILSTNLRQNIDEAFTRRLAFTVHFPFPDAEHRRRIWTAIWPRKTPLDDDIDFDFLAERFKLSGGNIKNVALAAAFVAAHEGAPVGMRHLLHCTRREFQKQGKALSEAELALPELRAVS